MAEQSNPNRKSLSAPANWSEWLERVRQPGPVQIAVVLTVLLVLALLIAGGMWVSATNYSVLYRGLAEADAGQIVDALQKASVPVKLDTISGAIMVPSERVHEARLKLATQGLPRSSVNGLESLQQNNFGLSQFMETARYQHALEGELARSIMTISAVENARVHLAFPKESVFARQQQPPTASVLVQLRQNRSLDEGQVAAIVHLVASSVPKLKADQISVIDQTGSLLTSNRESGPDRLNLDQLEYTRRLEDRYARRVEELLAPVMGMGRVRAQVALEMDFTSNEETAERYEPRDAPRPLRSEQILDETKDRLSQMGVPGALSNQPTGGAAAPETVPPPAPAPNPQAATDPNAPPAPTPAPTPAPAPTIGRKEITRNYELDKRVSHTRNTPGKIMRVSTAVIIDNISATDAEGQPTRKALSEEEMNRITALVKQAVGFSNDRGDSINVMNAAFLPSVFDVIPVPVWQENWFLELVKWAVFALMSLLLVFFVVRPILYRFNILPIPDPAAAAAAEAAAAAAALEATGGVAGALADGSAPGSLALAGADGLEGMLEDRVALGGANALLEDSQRKMIALQIELLEQRMELARSLVAEDPKRAVHVLKGWMALDDQG